MEIRDDQWLSEIFGYPVFRVDPGGLRTSGAADVVAGVCEPIVRHLRQQPAALYYAKVPTSEVDLVRHLSIVGFFVVDVSVTFGFAPSPHAVRVRRPNAAPCTVREVAPSEQDEVVQIAETCFRYSRFHLDPLVPAQIANRTRGEWIRSYVRKRRGDRLWVALIDEHPVGFLAALVSDLNGKRIGTIDLIGVSPACQNRGIGQALVAAFLHHYQDACGELRVGTQAANLPSIRLYEKCGFAVVETAYVLHLHVRAYASVTPPEARCESVTLT